MKKRKRDRVEVGEVGEQAGEEVEPVEHIDESEGDAEAGAAYEELAAESDASAATDQHALVEAPEAAVERLEAEVEAQKDSYLRLAAEFDNFRKRVERQRSEIRQDGRSEIVRLILETLDNLERVSAVDPAEASVEDVIAGVRMVERSLLRELEGAGLVKVGSVGEQFDPNDHEAVSTALAPDEDYVDRIAAVLQVGYRFQGNLLRPARVQVFVTPASQEIRD